MKANELMVGDYIKFDGSPYIVEEISAKGWVHILDIKSKARVALSSDYILDFIEGIPITTEILEKNGFEEYDDMHFRWEYCEGIYINADFIAEEPSVIINNRSYFCYPQCFYVHQLQQALRLCRINKEIVWMDL